MGIQNQLKYHKFAGLPVKIKSFSIY